LVAACAHFLELLGKSNQLNARRAFVAQRTRFVAQLDRTQCTRDGSQAKRK
jgi:hypothetical protein